VPLLGIGQPAKGNLDQQTLDRALRVIQANYYDSRLDYGKLSQGTVKGLVEGLNDPFSYYLDPAEYQRQLNTYAGHYVGIGIEVGYQGEYPSVIAVFPDSPAQKAGLQAGDIIRAVDGKDTHNLNSDQTSLLIRGPSGTTITLLVQRGDQRLELKVTRGNVVIPSVRSSQLEGSVLYIRIYTFGGSTAADFDKQLKDGLPGTTGVIVDLRDDGGGFIDAAQNVISQFVPDGEAFELHDRAGHVERHLVEGEHPATTVPVVVLVNSNTASASEMVSGSLLVRGRAKLVGTVTYGKGSVQQDFELPDHSDLHLTIKKWFLPNGTSVDHVGLHPTLEARLDKPDQMFDVSKPGAGHAADKQLNLALELLSGASG
jgi:carboxyl-terminal processing protease